jgi:acylphosphatase
VFFRAETQRAATGYNLTGWVRNLADGGVEALLEGEGKNVDEMLEWCRKGPPAARVENVIVTEEPYTGEFNNFTIKF